MRALTYTAPPPFVLIDSHVSPCRLDRARFRRDRGRRIELGQTAHPLVGHRRVGGRAFPAPHVLEVHPPVL